MALTRRCPFCAEEILADAIKCRHCGEFLDVRGSPCVTGNPAGRPRASTPTRGDNFLTVVIVAVVLAGVVASIFVGAFLSSARSSLSEDGTAVRPTMSPSEQRQASMPAPAVSEAYRRGYSQGVWRGNFDRNRDSYAGLTPDEGEKWTWTSTYNYRRGTQEYGDFWAGYEAGYLESRR